MKVVCATSGLSLKAGDCLSLSSFSSFHQLEPEEPWMSLCRWQPRLRWRWTGALEGTWIPEWVESMCTAGCHPRPLNSERIGDGEINFSVPEVTLYCWVSLLPQPVLTISKCIGTCTWEDSCRRGGSGEHGTYLKIFHSSSEAERSPTSSQKQIQDRHVTGTQRQHARPYKEGLPLNCSVRERDVFKGTELPVSSRVWAGTGWPTDENATAGAQALLWGWNRWPLRSLPSLAV